MLSKHIYASVDGCFRTHCWFLSIAGADVKLLYICNQLSHFFLLGQVISLLPTSFFQVTARVFITFDVRTATWSTQILAFFIIYSFVLCLVFFWLCHHCQCFTAVALTNKLYMLLLCWHLCWTAWVSFLSAKFLWVSTTTSAPPSLHNTSQRQQNHALLYHYCALYHKVVSSNYLLGWVHAA